MTRRNAAGRSRRASARASRTRQIEALVRQPVPLVVGMTLAQAQPAPKLSHRGLGLVHVPVRDCEERPHVARLQFVQALRRREVAPRRCEHLGRHPSRLVPKPARATPFDVVEAERRLVHAIRDCKLTDGVGRLEANGDALRRTRDEHRFDERAEAEQQVALRWVAGRQVPLRIEAKRDPLALVRQHPRLRVVRGRRAIEPPFQAAQLAKISARLHGRRR